MMDKKRTVFLTGTTGLVGSYLLKILLENNHKVYALARSKNNESAQDRVKSVLNFWDKEILDKNSEKLVVLESDIVKDNLGLDEKSIQLLKNEVEEIFHCAAITKIDLSLSDVRKVNVEGTKRILDLSLRWNKRGKLRKVNHISTAYICGNCQGIFEENDLDVGQQFNTTYEQSKFEAEKLIEDYRKKGLWIDIFRPPIIIGESNTGKIFQFRNIYDFIYLCSLDIFDSFPLLNLCVNLVPINFLSKAIYFIFIHTEERNKNYHVFPRESISIEKIIDSASEYMGFKKPKVVLFDNFNMDKFTPVQKRILQKTILALNFKVKLDSNYTNGILDRNNFIFPELNKELFLRILTYFNKERSLSRVR